MKDGIPLELPITLGGDIAGVVSEVGSGVTGFQVGDHVYGQANFVAGNSGAFAEFALTKAGQLANAPSNIDLVDAASLPLVGISALQAIAEHLDTQPGQKILIHGGAGGIGSIAVQIAKHIRAHVAVTVANEDSALAKELGADEIIDYKTQDFTEIVSDYDAVFDTAGGDTFVKSFSILKKGGKAVTMIANASEKEAEKHGITALRQGTKVTTERLEKLAKLVEDGVVTTRIAKQFPLNQIKEAFELLESGAAKGKIVIVIK
jgi:NADPH:quinone reductase-like Zn-dependent oxidoreductase